MTEYKNQIESLLDNDLKATKIIAHEMMSIEKRYSYTTQRTKTYKALRQLENEGKARRIAARRENYWTKAE